MYYLRIIEFNGTDDLYLKEGTTTAGVGTDTEIDSCVSSYPTSISQQLNIKDGTSTISAITVKCTNESEEISDLIYEDFYNEDSFYEKKCEIVDMDISTLVKTVIYTGTFDKISNDIDETWYGFTLKDGLEKLKITSLASTTTDAETFALTTVLSEEMPDTTDFTRFGRQESVGEDGDYLYNFEDTTTQSEFEGWRYDNTTGAIISSGLLEKGKIYKIITYNAGDDFSNLADVKIGIINTTGCIFEATDTTPTKWTNSSPLDVVKESEVWIILSYSGHPIDLAKYLFGQLEVDYDNTSFEAIRDDTKNATIDSFYYEWKEPIKNTSEWLSDNIFKPLNCYPIVNSDGDIYLQTLKQPTVTDLPAQLDDSNIIKVTKNSILKKDIINHTFVDFDYNVEKDEYISQVYDIANIDSFLNDSVGAFGYSPKSAPSFEVQGLNSLAVIDGSTSLADRILFAQTLSAYLFSRFALTTRCISVDVDNTTIESEDIKTGDVVHIGETKIIQWKGTDKGTRGLPILDTTACAQVDLAFWGSYVDIWESNTFLSDGVSPFKIRVTELIALTFFQDLLTSYNLNDTFLTHHGVI